MSGAAFGSFMQGASSGYNLGRGIADQRERRAQEDLLRREQEKKEQIPVTSPAAVPVQSQSEAVSQTAEALRQQEEDAQQSQFIAAQGAPQQQGGGMSINPQMMQSMMSSGSTAGGAYSGGFSSAGAAPAIQSGASSTGIGAMGTSSALPSASSMGFGGSAGAGAGGAGAGGASGMAAAGPWAALAAVIIANESTQKKTGNRREGTQYWKDLIGGKVLEQDMNKYADKWDKDNEWGINSDMKTFGNANTFDVKNTWKNAKKGGVAGALLKKIF